MSKQGGLGKGLGALIPAGKGSVERVAVDAIRPSSHQPRRDFDDAAIGGLAASMKQVGVLQPVVLRQVGESSFELIAGERRWRAARRAGLPEVPAVVVETDDRGALERALIENIQREDLNPIEQAAGFAQLLSEAGLTHEVLAERVGLSRPAVSNSLRLLDLPDDVKAMVVEGRLSAGHGRALLGLEEHPLLIRLAQRVVSGGLSVRETERLVRKTLDGGGGSRRRDKPLQPAGLGEVAEALSDHLETRVSVEMGRRKGKVVIEFGSMEDLKRIYGRITKSRQAI